MRGAGQRGQTAVEYLGLLLVVAAIIAALVGSGIGGAVAGGIQDAICSVTRAACDADDGEAGASRRGLSQHEQRERDLAPFAATGVAYQDLLSQARAARERGDLVEAERLLDLLEHYRELSESDRGDVITDLAGPSDDAFADLVDRGTIDEDGGRNRRYFTVPPSPGDGVVVMDFFIPTENSGPLKGDDRDTVDPLLGDAGLDKSRVMVIVDRETGRGVILQSPTCAADYVPGNYCEAARPIELGGMDTRPQINPLPGRQAVNEYNVTGGDGTLEVEYDALNSITPVGVSVDGKVRFERGDDGYYKVVEDTRDEYPRIVTGQYKPDARPRIIDETEDDPVIPGALPDVVQGPVEAYCDLPPWARGIASELVC